MLPEYTPGASYGSIGFALISVRKQNAQSPEPDSAGFCYRWGIAAVFAVIFANRAECWREFGNEFDD
jgi:hypothetical protein